MARLKLYLLGSFMTTLDGVPLAGLRSGKSRALLAYLAGEAGRPHQRAVLATLLWGEHPNDAARLSLRVALSNLREAVAPLDPDQDHPALLEITHQAVQLNLNPEKCWTDVAEFDARLAACAAHPHQAITRCPPCVRRLEEAIALYRGDFLADLTPTDCPGFEEWRLLCQERYHHQATVALEQIAQYNLGEGNYAASQRYARQLLALEPWHEKSHRHLMQALALDGQRCAALAQYDTCRQTLAQELGIEPEAETTALWTRIRDGTYELCANCNLPTPLTPLIDRVAELARIETMLHDPACRLLTLIGPGGIGKTRLALAAAAQHSDSFPDGVYFVPAPAAGTPEALDRTLAEALQFNLTGGGAHPKSQLLNYLRHKDLLLVLDDLRSQPATANWIVELLQRVHGCRILATAHQRLNVRGEYVLRVEGLAFPEDAAEPWTAAPEPDTCCGAINLFVQTARRVQPDFALSPAEAPHITRICRLVEGMPLAIELAATWITTLSCAEIAQEITHDLGFLTTSLQDVPERHRSLRAVFDQSWGLLSSSEQEALSRMSVFHRGFDRVSASAIADASLPLLASLTDKALLRRDRGPGTDDSAACYSLHELVRQYAADRLAEQPGEPANTQDRHSSYYLGFLARRWSALTGADQPKALAEIAQQSENVQAAWNWAIDRGRWSELENALPSLFLFYYIRSWFHEGEFAFGRLAEALINQGGAGGETLVGQALVSQGWFVFLTGHIDRSQALFDQGLALLRSTKTQQALAFGLVYRGAMALLRSDIATAYTAAAESLALYEITGDRYGVAVACNILGRAAHQAGDYDEARRQCQRNLEIARQLGNQWSMAFSLELLGRIALAQADARTAGPLFTQSLAIRREIGDRRGVGLTLNLLGDTHLACGADADAERCYREALSIFQALGQQAGSENAQAGLARIMDNIQQGAY